MDMLHYFIITLYFWVENEFNYLLHLSFFIFYVCVVTVYSYLFANKYT